MSNFKIDYLFTKQFDINNNQLYLTFQKKITFYPRSNNVEALFSFLCTVTNFDILKYIVKVPDLL